MGDWVRILTQPSQAANKWSDHRIGATASLELTRTEIIFNMRDLKWKHFLGLSENSASSFSDLQCSNLLIVWAIYCFLWRGSSYGPFQSLSKVIYFDASWHNKSYTKYYFFYFLNTKFILHFTCKWHKHIQDWKAQFSHFLSSSLSSLFHRKSSWNKTKV